jgi:hypothetical protein
VCFTVRAVLDVRNPIPWAAGYRQALEGCSVEDGAAVVRFAYPVRDPASLLSLPVLPAHKFETTHIPPAHLAARVAMGSRSEAVRFDDGRVRYSLANTPQGRSHFATVEQRPPSTPELDAIAVVRGEVDGIVDLDPSLRRRLAKQSAVNLHKYDTGAQWMMVYDTTKPPFDTRLPRMAVRAALDRELVRWALIPDASRVLEPVSGPFPLGSPHYDVGVRTLGVDDLEAGTRYLFGKTVPVRLGVPPDMERRAPGVGEMFATLLAKVGFEVQIVPLDEDPLSLGAARPPQGFDLALAAYQIPMAHSAWELLHTDGTLNPFGTSDPALDALLAKERGMSTDDLGEAMRAVHRMVDDQVPLLPLWSLSTSSAWGAAIQDVVITPGSFWEELDGWHRVGR